MTRIFLLLLALHLVALMAANHPYYMDHKPIHHAGHDTRGPRLYDTECTIEAFKQCQEDNHRIPDEHDEERRARLCAILERNKERRARRDAGLHASNEEGITSMSDLSDEEYQNVQLHYPFATETSTQQPSDQTTTDHTTANSETTASGGDQITSESGTETASPSDEDNLPAEFDWRNYGLITPIQNQGYVCGSCWAFAIVAAMESAFAMRNETADASFPRLSAQHLVDCSTGDDNGCDGWWPKDAMEFIAKNGGISTERSYPYVGDKDNEKHECKVNQETIGGSMKGPKMLKTNDEESLKRDLLRFGPIVILFDANHTSFQNHLSSGVFEEPKCDPTVQSHVMLLVGYGTDPEKGDYWTIKNSWGENWGEKGYGRTARNKNNHCGIATGPLVPDFG